MHNKAFKMDAIDSASVAHGSDILYATAAPLLHRLIWRYSTSVQEHIGDVLSRMSLDRFGR
jgi:hypothetical protein